MKKSVLAIAAALLGAAMFLVPGAANASNPARQGPGGASKNESYLVITVLNLKKEEYGSKYKVIETSRLKDEEKRIKDDWEQRIKVWQDDRKSDSTLPRPLRPIVKRVKAGFLTREGAQNYVKKLEDEEAAKNKDSDQSDSN